MHKIISITISLFASFSSFFKYVAELTIKKYHFQVKITFALDEDITFLTGVSADDIRGQRQIFDVAKPIAEDQHLPVVEEGTNCDIFFC